MQARIQHVYSVYGQNAIAYFERALAICRSARSNVGHNQRARLDLVVVRAATDREAVRVVLLFQLYVNRLRANGMMRMNRFTKKKKKKIN